jgi:predicted phosphodiesterase
MKYALISDIHGNLPSLLAVLEDAKAQGADRYLFLGDYIEDLPWPNEVVETIKKLDNAVIIRGNKEGYLADMRGKDQSGWVYEQMAPMYWNYRELTTENLEYLIALPASDEIKDQDGRSIYLSHSSSIFYRRPKIEPFLSSQFHTQMLSSPFSHEEYLAFSKVAVSERQEVAAEISALPAGVHAFGHNHLQWHIQIDDKLFINAGSCGMPLDFDTRAPYTMLELTVNGWRVEERRVPYDVDGVIKTLMSSVLYKNAEIWSRIMIKQLRTGRDYISRFLCHVEALAQEKSFPTRPVSNKIWREAADSFASMDI